MLWFKDPGKAVGTVGRIRAGEEELEITLTEGFELGALEESAEGAAMSD